MQLFDTATEALTTLTPRDGRVGIYVCGITPYDGGHLGHAFTYHTFDVIARRLWADGVDVRSVRNVTDVDDDILRVARERGIDYRVLGDRETLRFDRDMADLGLLDVDAAPRASNRVPEMVEWITRLVATVRAYEVRGLGVLRRGRASRATGRSAGSTPQRCCAVARARRQPRRPAQAQPARLRAVAAIPCPTSRAGRRRGATAVPAGTSSARCWPPAS